MKKIICICCFFTFFFSKLDAQIIYDDRVNELQYLTRFFSIGYKYLEILNVTSPPEINIYNLNHSLYTNIVVPGGPYAAGGATTISYVTDHLFDLDPGIEYVVNDVSSPTYNYIFKIFDESGTVLFSRDSGFINSNIVAVNPIWNTNHIFYNGVNTKMRIGIQNGTTFWEYYTLPGYLPCVECNNGLITGFTENSEQRISDPKFYPNPTSDYLKLKYQLPAGAKKAFIKVYDMQGKMVQDMEITNSFDSILLPPDYNNGLYLYSLIVDGVVVKNEKLVLLK